MNQSPTRLLALLLCVLLPLRGDVVINEVMTAGSERALQWSSTGVPKFGFGSPWHATAFNDAGWQTGTGPFGLGSFTNVSPAPTIGTNLATQMNNLTPTCYLRKTFTLSAGDAARTDALLLDVQYNDGFVAYLNGVEVVRRNAGPTNGFVYHDQFAAFGTPANNEADATPHMRTETLTLPAVNAALTTGTNVLAIHALNHWEATSKLNAAQTGFTTVDNRNNFFFKADLRVAGASPATFVTNNSAWKYFPGVAEPSGGVYDPALLFSGKLTVPWGKQAFDDVTWATGAAPFNMGTPPSGVTPGTTLTGVQNVTPSVYFRIVFTATAADIADPLALQLLNDWDDGFVAYLNGVEVARANMQEANAFTPHDAVASAARAGGTSTTYTLDPPAKLLINGQNVLAVQVHNLAVNDADLFFRCRLQRNAGARIMVDYTNTWKYFIGTTEPIIDTDEATEDNPEAPDSQLDWVELRNTGGPVSIANWSLSDDPAEPDKWKFPVGTTIDSGALLLVVCDGQNITAPASGGYLHTNFGLSRDGETLGLYDQTGALVQQLIVPAGRPFQSYGRDGAGAYAYYDPPSPLGTNGGATFSSVVADPTCNLAGGFYPGAQSVSFATTTSGATIRYTTDGSEPTETTGIAYTTPISVSGSLAYRARAFKTGLVPSKPITRTFLINEPASRRSVPALCLTGDQQRSLYRPHGIMAIVGGAFTNMVAPLPTNLNTVWSQAGPSGPSVPDLSAYNHPIHRGRFLERPTAVELLYPNGAPGLNTEFGARISGSAHARPRYQLTNQNSASPNAGAWSQTSFVQKPSFNFFFRDDLGGDPVDFPLFPLDPITQFHDVRCRAGKNDPSNPFIEDELMRRLYRDQGQVSSLGIINTLYVNGVYKGYYNLCAHLREDFFQRHHGSDLAWDVRQVTTIASGDGLSFQEMITFLRNNPQNVLANYQGMKTRIDVAAFIDYLIVNIFGVTGDWPHNNFVAARERSEDGIFRYYVWDAEGAFGDFSGNVRTNQFVAGTTGSVVTTTPTTVGFGEGIRILYTLLKASPEFRLRFADRLQKHFFNGGALTEAKVLARLNELRTEFTPLLNGAAFTDRVTPWVNGVGDPTRYTTSGTTNTPSRRIVLFSGYTDDVAGGTFVSAHLSAEGLWPLTLAPNFSQFGGTVAPGFVLTITNPNPAGTIYHTTDGRDPRAEGGGVQGTAGGSVTINFPTTVKARVLNTNGEWSPVTEAFFDSGVAAPLIISEVMYHPQNNGATDGDEYEFLEIKNTGASTVNLFGMKFTAGLGYVFPAGATVAPGAHKVIARNAAQFAVRYPAVPLLDSWGASSNLANSGETLTLADAANRTVFSVTYSDDSPWPVAADGNGPSLVPVNPNSIPAPNSPTNWRASTNANGSPGADDPAPPTLPIYLNEILASSSAQDRIELFNPNASAVNVGDWWLSDDLATKQKYRIPAGTSIPAGGHLVLDEAQFNVGANAFSFSSSGDEAVLSSGDATGALTGYSHALAFGASELDVSFGRYLNSQSAELFVAQKSQTFGAVNAGPRVGPVVLSEIMFQPGAGGDEYLEVRNASAVSVPMFDPANPANPWKIEGAGFDFPLGTTLQPGQVVLVSPLAPATFRSKYNIPTAVAVYGPMTGALNNGGERVALQKPGAPIAGNVPYIDVDALTYDDLAPWPAAAGNGAALQRANALAFPDDPLAWQAGTSLGTPTPQTFATWLAQHTAAFPALGGANGDPDLDLLSNFREWAHGLNPLVADAASAFTSGIESESGGSPYLTIRYRRSLSATSASFFGDIAAEAGTWTLDGAIQIGTPINNGDGSETITERDTVPATGATPRRFIRLRISAPP